MRCTENDQPDPFFSSYSFFFFYYFDAEREEVRWNSGVDLIAHRKIDIYIYIFLPHKMRLISTGHKKREKKRENMTVRCY